MIVTSTGVGSFRVVFSQRSFLAKPSIKPSTWAEFRSESSVSILWRHAPPERITPNHPYSLFVAVSVVCFTIAAKEVAIAGLDRDYVAATGVREVGKKREEKRGDEKRWEPHCSSPPTSFLFNSTTFFSSPQPFFFSTPPTVHPVLPNPSRTLKSLLPYSAIYVSF